MSTKSNPPKRQLEGNDIARPCDVEHTALILGIDSKLESYLLWVARDALETPLPSGWLYKWNAEESAHGYFNTSTQEFSEAHPSNAFFKEILDQQRTVEVSASKRNEEWMEFKDENDPSKIFYYNFITKRTAESLREGDSLISKMKVGASSSNRDGMAQQNEAKGQKSRRKNKKVQNKASSIAMMNMESKVEEQEVLEFKSWWNEAGGGNKVMSRHYVDIFFQIETGNFQILIDGSEKVYTLSHIEGPHGPIRWQDLHLGAQINILGRKTTLRQASGSTIEWLERKRKKLESLKGTLEVEVKKYENKAIKGKHKARNKGAGTVNLRLICSDIALLSHTLRKYRPKLCDNLIKTFKVD
eukprot:g3811.t1